MANTNYEMWNLSANSIEDRRWVLALNALFERVIRTMLDRHTLRVVPIPHDEINPNGGPSAFTDGTNIHVDVSQVAYLVHRDKERALMAYRGLLYHEMGHMMFTPFGDVRRDIIVSAANAAGISKTHAPFSNSPVSPDQLLYTCAGVWAMVEEGRMEHFLIRRYRRMRAYLRWLFVFEMRNGSWKVRTSMKSGMPRVMSSYDTGRLQAISMLLLTCGRRYLPKKLRAKYLRHFHQEFPHVSKRDLKELVMVLQEFERTPFRKVPAAYTRAFGDVLRSLLKVLGPDYFLLAGNSLNDAKAAQHGSGGSTMGMQYTKYEEKPMFDKLAELTNQQAEKNEAAEQEGSLDADDDADADGDGAGGGGGLEDEVEDDSDATGKSADEAGELDGGDSSDKDGKEAKEGRKSKKPRGGSSKTTGKRGGKSPDPLEEMETVSEDEVSKDESINELMQSVTNYLKNNTVTLPPDQTWDYTDQPVTAEMRKTLAVMGSHFAPLVENTDSYWESATNRGRLNIGSVIHSRGRSFNVFDQWHESLEQESTFEIVVGADLSGSMRGYTNHVSQCCWVIKQMADSLGMPCTVMLYDDSMGYAYDRLGKPMPDRYRYFNCAGNTNPVSTIYNASAIMSASPMKHKLFLMLTDGSWARLRDGRSRVAEAESLTRSMLTMNTSNVSTILLLFGGYTLADLEDDDRKRYDFNEVYKIASVGFMADIAAKFVQERLRKVVGF